MYLTSVEVPKPPKEGLNFVDLLTRMEPMCAKSSIHSHQEMFSIGFLFSKFKMVQFEDLQFLYSCFSTLPSLVREGLINQHQKYMILNKLVVGKNTISIPNPFQLQINTYINQCVNDKLNNTNTFDQPVVIPKVEEDSSERYIREMLQKEKLQQSRLDIENEEAVKKLLQEEENQIQRQSSEAAKKSFNLNCPICLEQINFSDLGLLQCQHKFHRRCLCESFKTQIDGRKFPIKCPLSECRIEVISADVFEFVPEDYVTKFETYTFERYVDMHNQDMSWCPSAGCKYVFYFNEGDTEFPCPVCSKVYCLKCKVEYHKGMTCKQFNISRVFDKNDEKFIAFVKGAKYKQCPKCKFWVEKNEGCDHMTCRCSFQFCYICGGVYQNCACTGAARVDVFVPGLARPIEFNEPPRAPGIRRVQPPMPTYLRRKR